MLFEATTTKAANSMETSHPVQTLETPINTSGWASWWRWDNFANNRPQLALLILFFCKSPPTTTPSGALGSVVCVASLRPLLISFFANHPHPWRPDKMTRFPRRAAVGRPVIWGDFAKNEISKAIWGAVLCKIVPPPSLSIRCPSKGLDWSF